MRFDLVPETKQEEKLLNQNLIPTPMLAVLDIFVVRSLMAAQRIGIFSFLLQKPQTLMTLTEKFNLSQWFLEEVLNTLVMAGYLQKEKSSYKISPQHRKWFDPQGSSYIGNYISANYRRWRSLEQFENMLATGKPVNLHESLHSAEEWKDYLAALIDLAKLTLPTFVKEIATPGKSQKLLDIGAGHGYYSIGMCQANPVLEATLFDLPGALEFAKTNFHNEKITNKVNFVEGNILEKPLSENEYDVIFLFNLIHHFQPDEIIKVFHKCYQALKAKGRLIIWEPLQEDHRRRAHQRGLGIYRFFLCS
jgi:ubiquinone/menaquinone biosynthesis C-methylase UbiE